MTNVKNEFMIEYHTVQYYILKIQYSIINNSIALLFLRIFLVYSFSLLYIK